MSEFYQDGGLVHEAIITGRIRVGSEAVRSVFKALAHTKGFWAKVRKLLTPIFRLVPGFDKDMRKEKWELLGDPPATEGEFSVELIEFLKDGESYVSGDEMVRRTKSDDNAGQRHAEAMLRDQDKIPQEFRKYVLVFPETLWRGPSGRRRVAYLRWDGSGWCLRFGWLEGGFGQSDRVVRLGKYLGT